MAAASGLVAGAFHHGQCFGWPSHSVKTAASDHIPSGDGNLQRVFTPHEAFP